MSNIAGRSLCNCCSEISSKHAKNQLPELSEGAAGISCTRYFCYHIVTATLIQSRQNRGRVKILSFLLVIKILDKFTLEKARRHSSFIIIAGAIIIITKLAIFKYDTIHHLMPATCSYVRYRLRDVSGGILILFRFFSARILRPGAAFMRLCAS
jgi:hypothetical protein